MLGEFYSRLAGRPGRSCSGVRRRGAIAASQTVLSVDPAHSAVHWTLDSSVHTVHGTFRVKRGTVSFDSATGKASGEIVVDAASGESGNDSRDSKMHNEVLESSKYADVIFRPERVEGTVKW